jgi:hypothetical protein
MNERPIFVLRVRAEPGVDVIRNFRRWLKQGLREFGLRCVSIHQESAPRQEVTMSSFSERYPGSGYFKAADLLDQPDLDLQIDYVDLDVEIGGKLKDVVRFQNDGRSLVLNRACGTVIAALHGDEIDDWAGKWITLFTDETVMFGNENKPGIRVRPVKPNGDGGNAPALVQPKRTLAQDLKDEIAF